MRIVIAECIHEVCSFNPIPTRYQDFHVHRGSDVLPYHHDLASEVAGALGVFASRSDVEVVPAFSARGITSGGTITAVDFRRLADEFFADLRDAGPVDAAYFALHGAMAADGEFDPEGYLLAGARAILGERVPIVASFDLHGILTDRMVQHTDAIVVYHTYPHVDFVETGRRAAKLLLRIADGEVKPVTAKVEIPALVRGDELITATGFFGRLIAKAQAIESGDKGLSAGMFIGNPFTDVPDLRSYAVVCMDGDAASAEREASALAGEFWANRAKLQAVLTPLADVPRIVRETTGTVVLIDAADATSSGAPGDGNAIVRELLTAGYPGTILAPIVDAAVVELAFRLGVGVCQVAVGGSCDPKRVQPLSLKGATIERLSDGRFRSESSGAEWFAGPTAVLRCGNLTLVVTSRPVHLYDRSLFLAHDLEPRSFDVVVVKSPHCQPHMYAQWCGRLINVDAPGATSANLPTLGHAVCRRPVSPLDEVPAYETQAKIFAR